MGEGRRGEATSRQERERGAFVELSPYAKGHDSLGSLLPPCRLCLIPPPGLEARTLDTYVTIHFEVSVAPCRSGVCSLVACSPGGQRGSQETTAGPLAYGLSSTKVIIIFSPVQAYKL